MMLQVAVSWRPLGRRRLGGQLSLPGQRQRDADIDPHGRCRHGCSSALAARRPARPGRAASAPGASAGSASPAVIVVLAGAWDWAATGPGRPGRLDAGYRDSSPPAWRWTSDRCARISLRAGRPWTTGLDVGAFRACYPAGGWPWCAVVPWCSASPPASLADHTVMLAGAWELSRPCSSAPGKAAIVRATMLVVARWASRALAAGDARDPAGTAAGARGGVVKLRGLVWLAFFAPSAMRGWSAALAGLLALVPADIAALAEIPAQIAESAPARPLWCRFRRRRVRSSRTPLWADAAHSLRRSPARDTGGVRRPAALRHW